MLAGDTLTGLLVLICGCGGRCGSRLTWEKKLRPEQSPADDVCVRACVYKSYNCNAGGFAVRLGKNGTSLSYRKNHSAALGGQGGGTSLPPVASKATN